MPYTEKKRASNARWDAKNLSRMSLAIPIALRAKLDARIAVTGESVNGFITRAIREALEREEPRQ